MRDIRVTCDNFVDENGTWHLRTNIYTNFVWFKIAKFHSAVLQQKCPVGLIECLTKEYERNQKIPVEITRIPSKLPRNPVDSILTRISLARTYFTSNLINSINSFCHGIFSTRSGENRSNASEMDFHFIPNPGDSNSLLGLPRGIIAFITIRLLCSNARNLKVSRREIRAHRA